MIIDLIYLGILLLAAFKGMKKGLIVALFSFIALIVGLAAALKLSAYVAEYLKGTVNLSARWMPLLAFLLIFLAVALVARVMAKIIESAAETMMMGWANKLGGFILFGILYTIIFSVVLFYLSKMQLLSAESFQDSKSYSFIKPWGPWIIDSIGSWWPAFKDLFKQLESFFGQISSKSAHL